MRIYVAGPYSSDDWDTRIGNVMTACIIGREIAKLGHLPFVPHKMTEGWERHLDYETIMRLSLAWLDCCEGLYYIGPSPGADRELHVARERGMVIFRSLAAIERIE